MLEFLIGAAVGSVVTVSSSAVYNWVKAKTAKAAASGVVASAEKVVANTVSKL